MEAKSGANTIDFAMLFGCKRRSNSTFSSLEVAVDLPLQKTEKVTQKAGVKQTRGERKRKTTEMVVFLNPSAPSFVFF